MWVARDKDLCLHFFSMKPNRLGNNWCVGDNVSGYSSKLDTSLFPDLKWEDEPREVELIDKDVMYNFLKVEEKAYEEYKQEVINEDYKIKAEGLFC